MKVNAPKKIYIDDFGTEFSHDWHTEHCYETSIEYIRTDVVYNWLENNLSKYSELTDEDEYGNKLGETVMNVFYGQAVEDFRKYMKGE